MIRHAIPYSSRSSACPCPVLVCGGIIPNPDCPDHGAKRNPAMEWHEAEGARCRDLRRPRYRCASGHLLPVGFQPPATEPDTWDDECRCKLSSTRGGQSRDIDPVELPDT